MNNKSGNQYSSFNSLMDGIKSQLGILIALLVMCVFLSIATNSFLATTNIFNVLRQIAVNVFLACGMTMVIILGGIDLSVGAVIALSGCTCASMIAKAGINPLLAILVGIALGAVVGLINGLIVAFSTIPPFIVTLATMNISRGLARVMVNNKTVAVNIIK